MRWSKTPHRLLAVTFSMIALLSVLSGCGGSSDGTSTDSSASHPVEVERGPAPEPAGSSEAGTVIAQVYGDEPFQCPADQARASAVTGVALVPNPGAEGSEVQCGYIDSVHAGSMHVVVNFRFDPGEVIDYDREQVESMNSELQCRYEDRPSLGDGAFGAACSGPDEAVTGTIYFQMPDGSRTWVVEVGNIAGATSPFTPTHAERAALELVTDP